MSEIDQKEQRKRELRERMIQAESIKEKEGSPAPQGLADFLRQRRGLWAVLLFVLAVGVMVFFFFALLNPYMRYGSYKLNWIRELNMGSLESYEDFAGGFLKISRDGVSWYKTSGQDVWIESHEMKNPRTYKNGNFCLVYDASGSKIELFEREGKTGEIDTNLPIIKAVVAKNGVVVVLTEDRLSTYIQFYDRDGKDLDVSIKTKLSGKGFPVDISLNPSGTGLLVGFQVIAGGKLKGRIVFYDFSEVGQNLPGRLAGGFDDPNARGDSLICRVHYMDSIHSMVVSTSGLSFYSSKNITSPAQKATVQYEGEIEAIAYTDKNVAVVVKDGGQGHLLHYYDVKGKELWKKAFTTEFETLDMEKDFIYLYNRTKAVIYSAAGVEKFNGDLDLKILKIRKSGWINHFVVLGETEFRGITLR